jgi:hypothetical protein
MKIYENKKDAMAVVKTMRGWTVRIVRVDGGYAIQCNGVKYLCADGFVR